MVARQIVKNICYSEHFSKRRSLKGGVIVYFLIRLAMAQMYAWIVINEFNMVTIKKKLVNTPGLLTHKVC